MNTFSRLLGFLRQPWRFVALAILLGWATTISWFALISTSAYLISFAALQPSIAELQVAIVGVRFFGIARAVFRYLERFVSHTVTFKLLARLRSWLYSKIEPQAPAGLESDSSSDLLSRIVSDIETLQDFYVRTVAPPVVALLSSIGVLWFIGQWSFKYALILLIFQLLAGVVVPVIVWQRGKLNGSRMIAFRAEMTNLIIDGVQGSAETWVFAQHENFERRLESLVNQEKDLDSRHNLVLGGHTAGMVFLANLSAVILLISAIPAVHSGELDGRLLAVIILGAIASFEAIVPLPQAFQNLGENLAAGNRLFDLADRRIRDNGGGSADKLVGIPSLEFKNVSFAYRHDEGKILTGLDLELTPCKKIAILGSSGVGKSTVANLLLRFWEPTGGRILISEVNIQNISPEKIRSQISYVPQNPFLFNTSVEENIRIGNPNADKNAVVLAAARAEIDDFIRSLPEQYETSVGEYGMLLSGGQRQRIALARALLRDAPIYLFDEPTANLDSLTERAVINNIFDAVKDKSLLWITHRLTRLEEMDEIVLLAGGRVAERGTHQDLIQVGGRYARMNQLKHDGLNL